MRSVHAVSKAKGYICCIFGPRVCATTHCCLTSSIFGCRMRVFSFVAVLQAALSLTWRRHVQPLQGELVLTDVHAFFDAETGLVTALATGEAGVVLRLSAPVANASGGATGAAWTTLLDTSFPLYWYGAYVFSASQYLLSGFLDGDDKAYGVLTSSNDGGVTWANDSVLDPHAWGGGPIEFANATEGWMESTAGGTAWRTTTGGRTFSDWHEVVPDPENWHAGNYIYDGDGLIVLAGSSDCNSTDFGVTWSCYAPVDSSGMDSGIACAGATCLVGGGEISPAVLGWTHVSGDGGRTWTRTRALNAPYPVRTVQAVPTRGAAHPTLVAAGGNFYSAQGGVFSSTDGGVTWTQDLDLGEEVKACRTLALPGLTRVYCVSAGQQAGSIVSADIPA